MAKIAKCMFKGTGMCPVRSMWSQRQDFMQLSAQVEESWVLWRRFGLVKHVVQDKRKVESKQSREAND